MLERSFECTLDEVNPTIRKEITQHLAEDEKVLFCSCTEWNMIWVQVVTQTQVIIAKAILVRSAMLPMFGKPRIEMPKVSSARLDEIAKTEKTKSKTYDLYTVQITKTNDEILEACFINNTEAYRFYNALQSTLESANTPISEPTTPTERMRELTHMHTEGLISDSEFEQKRQQILKEL